MLAKPLHRQRCPKPGTSGTRRDTASHRCRSGAFHGQQVSTKSASAALRRETARLPGGVRLAMVQTSAASGVETDASCRTTVPLSPKLQTVARLPGVGREDAAGNRSPFHLRLRLVGTTLRWSRARPPSPTCRERHEHRRQVRAGVADTDAGLEALWRQLSAALASVHGITDNHSLRCRRRTRYRRPLIGRLVSSAGVASVSTSSSGQRVARELGRGGRG